MNRAATNLLILVVYAACLYVASVRPLPDMLPERFSIDKLYHGAAYAIMAVLIVRAVLSVAERRRAGGTAVSGKAARGSIRITNAQLVAVSTVLATAFGIAMEVAQSTGVIRYASPYDAVANFVGALAGSIAYVRFFKRR